MTGKAALHESAVFDGIILFNQISYMRRGFNKYGNDGQDDSQDTPNDHQSVASHNFNLVNQFTGFSPSNGFSDGMIMTLFQVVEQQSRALQALMQKVDTITQRTLDLTDKIRDLRRNKRDERETDLEEDKKIARNQNIKAGDIVEASQLIKILFGSDKQYKYKLRLAKQLQLPLYRERNFFPEIQIIDLEGKLVRNSNKIPLSLALYSSENPPKFIEKNTAGQKILKGNTEQSLHQGICRFNKIQIKEVTSHFRNGWVFLVIIPSMTPFGCNGSASDSFIDYTEIEPLALDHIVVKAKKLKQQRKEPEGKVQASHEEEIEGQSEEDPEEIVYSEDK